VNHICESTNGNMPFDISTAVTDWLGTGSCCLCACHVADRFIRNCFFFLMYDWKGVLCTRMVD